MRAAPPEDSELATRVVDAAERVFERSGVRGCTIDEIAREAGVSRVTVYRHVGGKDQIFRRVMLRNSRAYWADLERDFASATTLEEVVAPVFRRARANFFERELFQTLLKLEAETVLRMVTLDAVGYYVQGVPFLAPHLAPFLPPGEDPALAAEWVIRMGISVVATAGHLLDPGDPDHLERLAGLTAAALRDRCGDRSL